MKINEVICLGLVSGVLAFGGVAEAGGSLPREELVKVLGGSGVLGGSVTAAFDLDDVAVGTRLGRQYGALDGARIGPYFVKAKPKGTAGNPTVMLRIETKVEYLDGAANALPNAGVGAPEGSVIKELVTGWSVFPLDDDELEGGVEEKKVVVPSVSEAVGAAGSKAVFTEVGATKLVMEEMAFEFGDEPGGGEIKRWRDSAGRVRRVEFSHGGEHSALIHEVYYDVAGNPRFLMNTLSSWGFVPGKPGVTRDELRERRFYINQEGLTVQVLEKFYEGEGDAQIKAAQAAAKNIALTPDAYATRKFVVYAREMRDAKKAKFMALSEELSVASNRLLEPAPSIKEKHWASIGKLPVMRLRASDRMEIGVMDGLIRAGLVQKTDGKQEGNYQVIPEVVGTEADAGGMMKVWVVVTASGLADDAIEAERYLARLEGPGNGELVLKYLGKQVKNWEGRGAQGWR